MIRSASLIAALVLIAATSPAQDRKLQRNQLPPAVASAVDREAKGADIKGFATEKEHGVRVYEAETVLNNHTRDLQFTADGTLTEVEEEVAFETLPDAVRSAFNKKAGAAKITKVESLTKQGKLVAYEAATLNGTHKAEIQLGPNGEKLAHEE